MNIKKSIFAAPIAIFASSTFSGDIAPMHGFEGSLGRQSYAVDIVRLSCGTLEGITIDHASVNISDQFDFAKPRLNVMIAKWNGRECVNWSRPAGDPRDDDGIPSAERSIPMPPFGGQYCLMIFKTPDNQDGPNPGAGLKTAVGNEEYLLDTHCAQQGVPEHPESPVDAFLVDM